MFRCRTRHTNRPLLAEGQLLFSAVSVTDFYNRIQNGVFSVRRSPCDLGIQYCRGNHRPVCNAFCFRNLCNNRSTGYMVSGLYLYGDRPFFLCIQRIDRQTAGDVFSGFLGNFGKRTFYTVEYIMQDSGAESNRNGSPASLYHRSRTKAGGLLIYLDGCLLGCQADYLTDQFFLADIDHLTHLEASGVLYINNRAVDAVDNILCVFRHAHSLLQR